jgi:hypothetical protein
MAEVVENPVGAHTLHQALPEDDTVASKPVPNPAIANVAPPRSARVADAPR